MYIDIFSHTRLTLLRVFITWQHVSTSNVRHHHVIVQEHESVQKLSTIW